MRRRTRLEWTCEIGEELPSPKEEEVAHLEEVGEAEELDRSFEDTDDLEAAVELEEGLATAI